MHIDVNNAFLSWTAVDLLKKGYKIDIRNIESVIGGDESKRHGIVLAKSMVAKSRGVKTAETIRDARRKCNNLKVFPPNHKLYQEMSNKLFRLISNYTPDIEKLSVDECFIDYTKVRNLYGDPIKFAYKLKSEIKTILGFTVNIGIANNKLCAKMASDFSKPFKIHTLFDYEIKEKMYPLPIEELFGIGKKTAPKLRSIGINKIEDLANSDIILLSKYFKNQALKMIETAKGIDNSEVISEEFDPKGISHSTTLKHDLIKKQDVYKVLNQISEQLGIEIRKKNKYASVINTFVKNSDFVVTSHQKKLDNPTNSTKIIYETSKKLLDEMWKEERIRLVGIRLDRLTDKRKEQLSIFEEVNVKDNDDKLEKIVDSLKEKYGKNIIS